jgi:hypothetical protein
MPGRLNHRAERFQILHGAADDRLHTALAALHSSFPGGFIFGGYIPSLRKTGQRLRIFWFPAFHLE